MAFRGKKWKYISLAEYYHSGEWRYYCELWGFREKEMNIVGQCIRGYDQALRVGRIRFQTAGNTDLWDHRECEYLFPGVWWREIRWICLLRDWQQADWGRAVGKASIGERSSRNFNRVRSQYLSKKQTGACNVSLFSWSWKQIVSFSQTSYNILMVALFNIFECIFDWFWIVFREGWGRYMETLLGTKFAVRKILLLMISGIF